MRIFRNRSAGVQTIGVAIAAMVTVVIGLVVFFNIAASVDPHTLDTSLQSSISNTGAFHAENATNATLAQAETFFTIIPLVFVIIAAVMILSYVGLIGKNQ